MMIFKIKQRPISVLIYYNVFLFLFTIKGVFPIITRYVTQKQLHDIFIFMPNIRNLKHGLLYVMENEMIFS